MNILFPLSCLPCFNSADLCVLFTYLIMMADVLPSLFRGRGWQASMLNTYNHKNIATEPIEEFPKKPWSLCLCLVVEATHPQFPMLGIVMFIKYLIPDGQIQSLLGQARLSHLSS